MSRENFILMDGGRPHARSRHQDTHRHPARSRQQAEPPDWIGLLEATGNATELEGIKMARPMTHDLLRSEIGEVGATVRVGRGDRA
jgi:bifunctional DNase/RNase